MFSTLRTINTFKFYFCFDLDCGDPLNVTNGMLTYNNTRFGDSAVVTCDVGFTPSVNVIQCTSDGDWNLVPDCIAVGRMFY